MEKLRGKLHFEMSKASHGKQQETHNLTPLPFFWLTGTARCHFSSPLSISVQTAYISPKEAFNKSDRCILVIREMNYSGMFLACDADAFSGTLTCQTMCWSWKHLMSHFDVNIQATRMIHNPRTSVFTQA